MRRTTVLLSGLLLLLAACGGDDGGGETSVGDAAGPITTVLDDADQITPPEAAPEAPLEEQTIEVGSEIYYAGFRAEIGESRLVLNGGTDEFGGQPGTESELDLVNPVVEVDAVVENLRAADASFPVEEIELEWATGSSLSNFVESDVIRMGANAGITFSFPVDETFSFDDATLYAGSPAEIRAAVPLSNPDATEAGAPIPLQIPPETGRGGPLELKITNMVALASDPWFVVVEQRPVDQPILEFTVDVTRHDDGFYDANVFVDDFRLDLPDGTQIAPESGDVDGLLDPSSTMTGAVVTFVLEDTPFNPEDLGGNDLTLSVTGTSVSWDGNPEARVPFQLQPQS